MKRQREGSGLRMSGNTREWLIVAAVISVAVILGLSALTLLRNGYTPSTQSTPGEGGYISNGQLASTETSRPVAESNGSLTFGGNSVEILVLMGPMAEGQSMYSFLIDNNTNPTLVLPKGSVVTMIVVNVDTDAYHGLTFTTVPPPYSYNFMPMMMSSFASSGVLPPSSSGFASQQISFTVTGDMHYACPVAGHAQSGMYGQIRAE